MHGFTYSQKPCAWSLSCCKPTTCCFLLWSGTFASLLQDTKASNTSLNGPAPGSWILETQSSQQPSKKWSKTCLNFAAINILDSWYFQSVLNTISRQREPQVNLIFGFVINQCSLFYWDIAKCAHPSAHHQWQHRDKYAFVPVFVVIISLVLTGTSYICRSFTPISAMVTMCTC